MTILRGINLADNSVVEIGFTAEALPLPQRLTVKQVGLMYPHPTTGKPTTDQTIKKWHETGELEGGFKIGGTLYFDPQRLAAFERKKNGAGV